ncbi:Bro-N domain-containing protein [Acidithiobacillus sp. MC6.1]|nr:Bro-N domain-containing protein [Acidithiobacillus sp. MC6.1]
MQEKSFSGTEQLIPFEYEGCKIRVITDDAGEPWWVAVDVCRVLGIANARDALARLDDDEKGVVQADTLGGKQNINTINESGLYSLTLSCRKPEAKGFKRWITHEVLPTLRKTGTYSTGNGRAKKSSPADQGLPDGVTMRQVIADIKVWVSLLRMTGLDKNEALLSAIGHESMKLGLDLRGHLPRDIFISSPVSRREQVPNRSIDDIDRMINLHNADDDRHYGENSTAMNLLLVSAGLLSDEPDHRCHHGIRYTLTHLGKKYGVQIGNSQEFLWKESVATLVEHVLNEGESQMHS